MLRRLVVLIALILSAPAVAAPVDAPWPGIKGQDDRTEVDSRAYPWSAVGRIAGPNGLRCTGTLVGAATVLTAAHCLWDETTGDWVKSGDLSFTTGWQAGWRLGTTLVESYDIASGYQGDLRDDLGRGASDWALLHLRDPLGDTAGWLGVLPLDAGTWGRLAAVRPVIVQAGYSGDRPLALTAHIGCRLIGWPTPGLLAHDCDATEGDSGAPLFAWVGGAFRVIGLHVATFRRAPGEPFGGDPLGAAVPSGAYADIAARFGASAGGSPAGSDGPAREVETALGLLGYAPDRFGLTQAIRAFERDQGRIETGLPTAATLGLALNALR